MCERTGFHIPQRAIPLVRPFRSTAPAGKPEDLDPTNPGSCHENNNMSARKVVAAEKDIQVIPNRRDMDTSPFGYE